MLKIYRLKIFGLLLCGLVMTGCADARRAKFSAAPLTNRPVEIGMLLRKQHTSDIYESRPYRHIDILFPDGEIFGFNTSAYDNSFVKNVISYSAGEVRRNSQIYRQRLYYIDARAAKNFSYHGKDRMKAITDWAKFHVTPAQARALRMEWENLAAHPPLFRLLGKNCATRAMECFERAGILPAVGIPGLDRPENLLKIVTRYYPDLTTTSGYFGLDENQRPTIEPAE